jgi:hypothetical protein
MLKIMMRLNVRFTCLYVNRNVRYLNLDMEERQIHVIMLV